jgi:hypothetical protein
MLRCMGWMFDNRDVLAGPSSGNDPTRDRMHLASSSTLMGLPGAIWGTEMGRIDLATPKDHQLIGLRCTFATIPSSPPSYKLGLEQ